MNDTDAEILAVLWTPWGGVNHNANHYRTLHWNTVTGRLALRAEYNHGLWKAGAYWWCRVGEALANGDIRAQLELRRNDDAAELADDGFTLPPPHIGHTDWRTSSASARSLTFRSGMHPASLSGTPSSQRQRIRCQRGFMANGHTLIMQAKCTWD